MSEESYPGEADEAAAAEAACEQPSPLTREQVEEYTNRFYNCGFLYLKKVFDDHDAALRRTIAQQAQEIAVFHEIPLDDDGTPFAAASAWRAECNRLQNKVTQLDEQLATALTREQVDRVFIGLFNEQHIKGNIGVTTTLTILRATIEQQAQEIEQLQVELLASRAHCDAWAKQMQVERDKYMAMRTERDEAQLRRQETIAMCTQLQGELVAWNEELSKVIPGLSCMSFIGPASTAQWIGAKLAAMTTARDEARVKELEAN